MYVHLTASGARSLHRIPAMVPVRDDRESRRLRTLEYLLELPASDLRTALSHASDAVASGFDADKVDAFLYDPSKETLVAIGTSNQPLSAKQRRVGLDILPLANGGRVVHVFVTGKTFITGELDRDPEELKGVREVLKIRSKLGVPLEVGGQKRGVLMLASQKANFFTADDVRFAESVAKWVAAVAHRAELVEQIAKNAAEQGRRAVAEELITTLAHDLRNYLNPVALRLNLIRRRAEREKRDTDIRDVDQALRSVQRLTAQISDILDVARIDQGVFAINPQTVDLVALVEEITAALATPAQRIEIDAAEEVLVTADPARIRQCFENVLSNAIKYSPAGRAVTVVLARETHNDGDWARVTITDEGPGIPAELREHLFERFVSDKSKGGLGLGLFLAKQIAQLHGGDLTAESPPGRGASFTLTLRCCANG
jgi:two-component system, OmpR family, sensor kinase